MSFTANKAATSSALLSTVAAFVGLCCVGPVAVTLFGVTGAIFLARLEPFRPLFLIPAGLLVITTAIIFYLQPLLRGDAIESNASQNALFAVSFFLVIFSIWADEILWFMG